MRRGMELDFVPSVCNRSLEVTLDQLERLPSRERLWDRVSELERSNGSAVTEDVRRFIRYVVRPCLAGASHPICVDEFRISTERFNRLWRRLP